VKTWYDPSELRLVVTVLSAADLPKRVSGQYRNPYAKVALQPSKRLESQTTSKKKKASSDVYSSSAWPFFI